MQNPNNNKISIEAIFCIPLGRVGYTLPEEQDFPSISEFFHKNPEVAISILEKMAEKTIGGKVNLKSVRIKFFSDEADKLTLCAFYFKAKLEGTEAELKEISGEEGRLFFYDWENHENIINPNNQHMPNKTKNEKITIIEYLPVPFQEIRDKVSVIPENCTDILELQKRTSLRISEFVRERVKNSIKAKNLNVEVGKIMVVHEFPYNGEPLGDLYFSCRLIGTEDELREFVGEKEDWTVDESPDHHWEKTK